MPTDALNILPFELPEHPSLGHEALYILGYNVERLLEENHMDIMTLSKVANVSRPVIYRMIRGESNSTIGVIIRIAEAFGVEVFELFVPPLQSIDRDFYRNQCLIHAELRREKFHEGHSGYGSGGGAI